jgi:hypothetical protein
MVARRRQTKKKVGAVCFVVIAGYMATVLMFAYRLQVNSGTRKLALGREEALENIAPGPNKFSEELGRVWSEMPDPNKLPGDVQFFLVTIKELEIKSYEQSLKNAEHMLNDIYNNMVIVKCESDAFAQESLIVTGIIGFLIMVVISVVLVSKIPPDADKTEKSRDEWEKMMDQAPA